ncbi:hypothetical protein UT300007_16520 [Clostridium sp. CTA-7]
MNRNPPIKENIFKYPTYSHYVVQYQGDIEKEFSNYPTYYVNIINDRYAIISLPEEVQEISELPYFSTIVAIKPYDMYTLQEISPLEASQASFLQLNLPLNLTGRNTLVAIIDTGIDYLNEEFMDYEGNTRIEYIWDQTLDFIDRPNRIKVPFGVTYSKEDIQEAINLSRSGGDPYSIVPSKDEIGHGTEMTGIIGSTGKNPQLKGVVPNCKFVVVKLIEDYGFQKQFNVKIPTFNVTSVFFALNFLYKYELMSNFPMVIYFPLGTSLGNHKGTDLLSRYIDSICMINGIVVVTGTGNERASGGHASGVLSASEPTRTIELDVSPEQENIIVEIWTEPPNIISLDIISPSGENTGVINHLINTTTTYTFLFEKTEVKVNYYIPEESSGFQLIRVRFTKLQPGIWIFRVVGDLILDGVFNAWIPQEGISVGGTHFIPADPYGTITSPGNATILVTAAAYNQNNNNILNYSGMAFNTNYAGVIDVAAGGVNALTVAPNNKTAIVNGTSVAAAIAAGACSMLFEWGDVQGNNPNMYAQTIKAYLARGVTPRPGDIYPNPQWGFGILNIFVMFQNIT